MNSRKIYKSSLLCVTKNSQLFQIKLINVSSLASKVLTLFSWIALVPFQALVKLLFLKLSSLRVLKSLWIWLMILKFKHHYLLPFHHHSHFLMSELHPEFLHFRLLHIHLRHSKLVKSLDQHFTFFLDLVV